MKAAFSSLHMKSQDFSVWSYLLMQYIIKYQRRLCKYLNTYFWSFWKEKKEKELSFMVSIKSWNKSRSARV